MLQKKRKYPDKIDFSIYGWTRERAQEIRKRDYFICQKCGKIRSSIVHHRDGDRRNNIDSNLVTLCRSCHKDVHMERGGGGRYKLRKSPLAF
jgi:5-methylcytosine-specific restriction endonuclease McrA